MPGSTFSLHPYPPTHTHFKHHPQIAFVSDPSNTAFEEVLHPDIIKVRGRVMCAVSLECVSIDVFVCKLCSCSCWGFAREWRSGPAQIRPRHHTAHKQHQTHDHTQSQERFEIEMAELDAASKALDEAEEEELWMLTLQRQARHIQVGFGGRSYCVCRVSRAMLVVCVSGARGARQTGGSPPVAAPTDTLRPDLSPPFPFYSNTWSLTCPRRSTRTWTPSCTRSWTGRSQTDSTRCTTRPSRCDSDLLLRLFGGILCHLRIPA